MKILKFVWLTVFLLGAGYFLLFSVYAGALSVIDGPMAQFSAFLMLLGSLTCLNIALTGYLIFDRRSSSA
jgi:hypothetical protein